MKKMIAVCAERRNQVTGELVGLAITEAVTADYVNQDREGFVRSRNLMGYLSRAEASRRFTTSEGRNFAEEALQEIHVDGDFLSLAKALEELIDDLREERHYDGKFSRFN